METEVSVKVIREIATSEETKEIARSAPKYFSRNRTMPFSELLFFMLNPAKECLQTRLNNYNKMIGKDQL